MNKEINKIIANLENCFGIFDYVLTPTESSLLVSCLKELQQENKQLRDNIRQMDNSVDKLQKQLIKEKDNWNKLKVYIKTEIPEDVFIDTEWFVSILDKMKELQGSDNNDTNR